MGTKTKILTGQATPEQIAEWKKKHGDIFAVTVGDSICYLKKPTRTTMGHVAALADQPVRGNELLLNDCWLGGDETIKDDDERFFGVSAKLGELLQVKQAEIEKL